MKIIKYISLLIISTYVLFFIFIATKYPERLLGINIDTYEQTAAVSKSRSNRNITPIATSTVCTTFTYSSWSACLNNVQSRTILTSLPSGCTGGSPLLTQACISEVIATTTSTSTNVLNLNMDNTVNGAPIDSSNYRQVVTNTGATQSTTTGYVGKSMIFNGNDYLTVADNDAISVSTTGELSIAFWIKPYTFDFTGESSGGYINFIGKGEQNHTGIDKQDEYLFRLYNATGGAENRPKRFSFYVFNLTGGLGTGSYFQDNLVPNEWIHVVGVATKTGTRIYKNGVLRDTDLYTDNGYNVVPQNGYRPLRIGTRDFYSYLNGEIDEFKIYNKALTADEVSKLYLAEKK